jgi:hypothetical protein
MSFSAQGTFAIFFNVFVGCCKCLARVFVFECVNVTLVRT